MNDISLYKQFKKRIDMFEFLVYLVSLLDDDNREIEEIGYDYEIVE